MRLLPIENIIRKLGVRIKQQHWQGFTGWHILIGRRLQIRLLSGVPALRFKHRPTLKNTQNLVFNAFRKSCSRLSQLVIVAAFLLSVLGCGKQDTPPVANTATTPATKQEQLAKQAFSVQQEAFDLLTGIRDQQSAEAAIAGLENIRKQVEGMIAEAKKSGAITPETKNRIMAEVEKHKKEITDKVLEFSKRLATNPQLLQSLQPVLQKLDELRRQYDGFIN